MEINGLPLHPLVVHAAVVFGPLAALAALAYLVPSWRERVRWPMVVLAVLATVTIIAAYLSGDNLLENRPELEASPLVEKHEDLADQLLWITVGFGAIALLGGFLARRGALRVVLDVLLALAAVLVLVWVVRTGDAGAQAVWG